jgi:hypothetical protein
VNYEDSPAGSATFGTNCVHGCRVNGTGGAMCGCTSQNFFYWSSTTLGGYPLCAWDVNFAQGLLGSGIRASTRFVVRAVRGGL